MEESTMRKLPLRRRSRWWRPHPLRLSGFILGAPVGCLGDIGLSPLSVSISYPVNNSWVPGWEPVSVAYALQGIQRDLEASPNKPVVCFRLIGSATGGCGPLQEGLPITLAELDKGKWYTLEATIETTNAEEDRIVPIVGVISRALSIFFTGVSLNDPWGHSLPNLAGATGASGLSGSCTPEMGDCTDKKAMRTAFFDAVYEYGVWAKHSPGNVPSGSGSTMESTIGIRGALEEIVSKMGIRRLLDVPCGDMTWMKNVDLHGIEYVGADVSQLILRQNRIRFPQKGTPGREFVHLDLVEDGVPLHLGHFDLIIVRDLMYHQTQDDNLHVIDHLEHSGARYIMISTYVQADDNNRGEDFLLVSGHDINLFRAPYCLRPPEQFYEDGEEDRYMGLWELGEAGSDSWKGLRGENAHCLPSSGRLRGKNVT